MSSAGRAASSRGCVARPRGRETGLTGYAEQIQRSLPTGSSAMETAEHREPYESRGSRTDLGAPGGENPPGDSTRAVKPRVSICSPNCPRVADIVRSAFDHLANPLVLQITAFWARANSRLSSDPTIHEITQNRLALVGEARVSGARR